MNLEYLKQADAILTKCGRPLLPGGASAVPIPRGFLVPMTLQPGASTTWTKEITGDTPWQLRAISCSVMNVNGQAVRPGTSLVGIRLQIQLPNGRFVFGGSGIDVGQFSWIGSWRWLQDPYVRCEPGSKFTITLTDTTLTNQPAAVPVNLVLEGAYLYYMQGGEAAETYPDVASWPRYRGDLNENILAPVWMANEAVDTPEGYQDDYFIYATPDPLNNLGAASWTITTGVVTARPTLPFAIQIDNGYDFYCRRMFFTFRNPLGPALQANLVGRLRTGAGYALNDGFINLSTYLSGADFGALWKIDAGDTVFIDAGLVDIGAAVTGTLIFQAWLEGWRRSKVA